jgi:acetyltransferase
MAILSSVFDPKTIALIGASDRTGSVGRLLLTNLLSSKDRKIFPVNPRRSTLLNRACYPDIRGIPNMWTSR